MVVKFFLLIAFQCKTLQLPNNFSNIQWRVVMVLAIDRHCTKVNTFGTKDKIRIEVCLLIEKHNKNLKLMKTLLVLTCWACVVRTWKNAFFS